MIVSGGRQTLEERLAPVIAIAAANAASVDTEGRFPGEAVEALRQSGLMGLTLSSAGGGLGGSPRDFVDTIIAVAAACGSTAMVYLMHVAALMPIASQPPPGQPDLVRELATGAKLG
ncbi:MAG: acyl-CoA dehydrogenase family protein, partial [Candidatus Dormibacteria bacterium]